jgi:hypothetical protein
MSERNPDLRKVAASIAAERAANAMAHPDPEQLVAYQSGELAPGPAEALRAHLGVCRDCSDMLLELDRVEREERRPWTMFVEWLAQLGDRLRSSVPVFEGEPVAAGGGEIAAGRRMPLLAGAAVLLVVPAALLVFYSTRHVELLPLGSYDMAVRGAIKATRGVGDQAPFGPFEFAPGMKFELNLYPAEPVKDKIAVEAFRSVDGKLEPWKAPVELSEEGAVRFSGRVGQDIVLPPGRTVLFVAIGRPDRLPHADELQQRLSESNVVKEPDWAAWSLLIDVVDRGEVE